MIQQKTVEAIYPLAEILTNNGKALVAIDDTPLKELVAYSYPAEAQLSTPSYPIEGIVAASMTKNAEGVSLHDVTMDEVVDIVAKTVSGNLDLARNTVNPLIKQVVDEVTDDMAAQTAGALQPLQVVTDHYHAVWNNPLLETLVENYARMPVAAIAPVPGLPSLTPEQLLETALTGVTRFDPDLRALIDDHDGEWLVDVYETFFRVQVDSERPRPGEAWTTEQAFARPVQFRDEILVAHFLSRKLLKSVPEGTEGDLDIYRDLMSELLAQTGRVVTRVLEQRERAKRHKQLVVDQKMPYNLELLPEQQGTIFVNGDVYNAWLAEGGSPEVLFGAAVTDREYGYNTLLENAERYREAWKRQSRVIATQVRFNRFNQLLAALERVLTRMINNIDDEILVDDRSVLHKRLQLLLSKVAEKECSDLFLLSRKLVCGLFFSHTDAEAILCAIDAVAKEHEDIEVREAALLATIEIVTEWVADLIAVKHVGA